MTLARKAQRKVLRVFAWADRPAAWLLMVGGFVTFVAVLFDLIATGDVKWVTLLVAADLTVSGFDAVQTAEAEEEDSVPLVDMRPLADRWTQTAGHWPPLEYDEGGPMRPDTRRTNP